MDVRRRNQFVIPSKELERHQKIWTEYVYLLHLRTQYL